MKRKGTEIRLFCEFVLPPMLIWSSIVIIPLIYGIFLTFTDWDGLSTLYHLIGLQNYASLFNDDAFIQSIGRTFLYAFFVVVLSNLLGLALALLLTYGIRMQSIFRTCFFAANMVGGIVMGYIWSYIFNFALTKIGSSTGWDLFETSWLTSPGTAMAALVLVTVWQMGGYLMVIYIAGLTNVSQDILEAATIDGASKWQLLRLIKLPMIRSSVTICTFMAISKAFMSFDVNLSLTAGGPYKSTELMAFKIYQTAFSNFKYGKGQAEAIILFIIVAIISLIQVTVSKKREVN